MKKILSIILILTLCFTLFACGDENDTDPTTTTTTQSSTTTTTQNSTTTTTTQNTTTTTTVMEFSTDDYCYTVVDGEATITMAYNVVGDVVIPSTLGGYPVTAIGEEAFANCTEITSVIIPDSVTSIGYRSFAGCINITSITIPESVTTIREYAFMYCPKLETLNLLGSTSIYYGVFDGCENLKTVNIPSLSAWFESYFAPGLGGTSTGNPLIYGADLYINGVKADFSGDFTIPEGTKTLSNHVFGFSDELTSITIPSSVSKICHFAFSTNDTGLTKPTNLKKVNITDLSAWCEIDFEYSGDDLVYAEFSKESCSTPLSNSELYLNGTKVDFSGDLVIPEGTKKIGDFAFCGYDEITSVTIPSSVTSIGYGSFAGCINITSITIPGNVASIGDDSFAACDKLKSVTLLNGVTSIGRRAFYGCQELTDITIPDSVTSIEDYTFTDCYNVTIHAKKDSYAYKYATDNKINVVALD